jgi:alkanesulfonate monooxygenase SsuD/methylene tetrahydromethanopterin reductase-like flavin-dependent oxidoreductase (luciferase family)
MKLGIYLDLRNPPAWRRPWAELYARRIERIVEAERLGLHSVWLSEHHMFADGYLPQPLTFAAAIAARTSRIRIGTAILLAPLRPALQIAEEAAIVDILSAGRLELGLGAGYLPDEFRAYGADHAARFETLRGRVREVRTLWDDGVCTPPPVQPRPPIWVGVSRPGAARAAGRLGEGLLWLEPALVAPYREGLEEGGHDPAGGRISGVAHIVLADDPPAAREAIREHHRHQQGSYREAVQRQMPSGQPAPISMRRPLQILLDDERAPGAGALPPALHVLTAPQAAALLIGWLGDAPVEHVFLWDSIGAMPEELADRHVELLGGELAPLVTQAQIR